jgi:hypothetical protein
MTGSTINKLSTWPTENSDIKSKAWVLWSLFDNLKSWAMGWIVGFALEAGISEEKLTNFLQKIWISQDNAKWLVLGSMIHLNSDKLKYIPVHTRKISSIDSNTGKITETEETY